MHKTIDITTDTTTLIELVEALQPNDEVLILNNCKHVATLVASKQKPKPRIPGLMKGKLTIVAEDEEHLADFKNYMP